jgi:4-carboxymuconolactone decarboxylase
VTSSDRKALIRLSAALARRDPEGLRRAMGACVSLADPGWAEEVILQSYLFLGYPVALNAFGMWREVSGRKADAAVPDAWDRWTDRGEEVCRTVYGGQYEGLRRNVRDLHPDMERWMVVEGYGKVLGRSGLDLPVRELCIVALLAVLGAPRQLHSHLRGALNAGAFVEQVEMAVAEAESSSDSERGAEARAVWDRVLERRDPGLARGAGEAG